MGNHETFLYQSSITIFNKEKIIYSTLDPRFDELGNEEKIRHRIKKVCR